MLVVEYGVAAAKNMEYWNNEQLEEWNTGRMEGWKDGRLE